MAVRANLGGGNICDREINIEYRLDLKNIFDEGFGYEGSYFNTDIFEFGSGS
jgi:hypothetical protein